MLTQARMLTCVHTCCSAFIVNMPFGFASEVRLFVACHSAMGTVAALGSNLATVSIGYAVVAYCIGAPFLVLQLIKTRKKKLGGATEQASQAKKRR